MAVTFLDDTDKNELQEQIDDLKKIDVDTAVSEHNISLDSHNDIRLLIDGLSTRLNALADSDDITLDQMSELVAYVKANKSLIDSVTTNKVNVVDIVDNLITNVSNKPLSASQGVILNGLIDALNNNKLDVSALNSAIETALTKAKESGDFNGTNGTNGKDGYTPIKSVDYYTDEDKAEMVADVVSSLDGIPDYWQTALDEGVEAINTALCEAGANKSAFLFYTDAHWNYGSQMSPTLLKYLYKHTGMTKTFFGGDIVNDEGTDYDTMEYLWEWRNQLKDLPNHHSVVGNHDDGNATNNLFSENYVYGYLLAPEETSDIVRGTNGMYYYIDNLPEKTRYLYLDTAYIGVNSDQQEFIKQALLSTPSGWHIVAVAHIWYDTNYDTSPPTIGNLSSDASVILTMFDNYNSRSGDYADCDGWVEFCVGGHTHRDYDGTSSTGIPILLVETDSQHVRSGLGFTLGTTTESSINGIIADYTNHKIYVVRIGRGESREIQVTNYVVSYTNVLTLAIGTDGQPFQGGKGYAENSRIGSGGLYIGTFEGADCTGFIPIDPTVDQVIRFKNVTMKTDSENASNLAIAVWSESFARLNFLNIANFLDSDRFNLVLDGTNITQITFPKSDITSGTKYLAICCDDINDSSIITINEPIEEGGA